MRILVLDEWIPFPPDSGKKLRTWNLLSRLAERHEIALLCYHSTDGNGIPPEVSSALEVVTVPDVRTPKHSMRYYGRIFANLLSPDPFSASYARTPEMLSRLQSMVASRKYDALICEWTPYARYLAHLDHPCKILMAHNVEFQQWERMFRSSQNPFLKALYLNQWKSMCAFETRQLPRFEAVMAVSELDKQLIEEMTGHEHVWVIPNGVDLDYFRPVPADQEERLIFTASMDAFVNQSGASYFADSIFPEIQEACPEMEFWVVGRSPNRAVRDLGARKGIVVTGSVPDVRPYIAKSMIAVIPLLAGGGTRLKILEAMAMGVPVVSTAIGAEGLDVCPGKDILIASSSDEFVRHVLDLQSQPSRRRELAANAMELVTTKYGWASIASSLDAALSQVAAASSEGTAGMC